MYWQRKTWLFTNYRTYARIRKIKKTISTILNSIFLVKMLNCLQTVDWKLNERNLHCKDLKDDTIEAVNWAKRGLCIIKILIRAYVSFSRRCVISESKLQFSLINVIMEISCVRTGVRWGQPFLVRRFPISHFSNLVTGVTRKLQLRHPLIRQAGSQSLPLRRKV